MYAINAKNANDALAQACRLLMANGQEIEARGTKRIGLPGPVCITIQDPRDRLITIPARRWNSTLPWLESLWILLGWNDLDALPGKYVKSLYNFSDDGRTWGAAYGPRIRQFDGNTSRRAYGPQHAKSYPRVDQLDWIIAKLSADKHTLQAVIEIPDVMKDYADFDTNTMLKTRDTPCTRSIQFHVGADDRLNCTVFMRSNDVIWGFSAVNVFNFTLMQEYVAAILGLKIGSYHHVATNLHYYADAGNDKTSMLQSIMDETTPNGYGDTFSIHPLPDTGEPGFRLSSLTELDNLATMLLRLERFESGANRTSPNSVILEDILIPGLMEYRWGIRANQWARAIQDAARKLSGIASPLPIIPVNGGS